MSIVNDRREADRDIEEALGLVPEFFRRFPDHLPATKRRSFKPRERRHSRRVVTTLIATAVAGLALVAPAAGAASSAAKPTPAVAIVPFAGDVFTVDSNNNLIQVDPRFTPASAPLYQLDGNPLGLSWGQWSSATATSLAKTITRRGIGYTDVRITMTRLIPGGVYSLFYQTSSPYSANPICGATVDSLVALPARFPQRQKPDQDSFVADSSGAAAFHARVAGRLLDAASLQIWVIFHFDGHVYGPVPNQGESTRCVSSFGIDAMRQFIIIQK